MTNLMLCVDALVKNALLNPQIYFHSHPSRVIIESQNNLAMWEDANEDGEVVKLLDEGLQWFEGYLVICIHRNPAIFLVFAPDGKIIGLVGTIEHAKFLMRHHEQHGILSSLFTYKNKYFSSYQMMFSVMGNEQCWEELSKTTLPLPAEDYANTIRPMHPGHAW